MCELAYSREIALEVRNFSPWGKKKSFYFLPVILEFCGPDGKGHLSSLIYLLNGMLCK